MESGLKIPLPMRWHWWEDRAHDGVTNMAVDEALLATVRAGEGTWRWYGWSSPTVSFGRNERLRGRITPDRLAASGLGAVRRPTGGRALLHHRELTYCVTMPLAPEQPWRVAYDAVNHLLLHGLRAAGIPVVPAEGAGIVLPEGPVCFDQPAAGELTVQGRKLVGSAVWRHGDAYLQHGSILLHDDQSRLQSLSGDADPIPAAATLHDCLPDLDDRQLAERVQTAVFQTLQSHGEVRLRHESPNDAFASALALQHRHFADPAWLWRR